MHGYRSTIRILTAGQLRPSDEPYPIKVNALMRGRFAKVEDL